MSAHKPVYTIAYSLTGISVVVKKMGLKLRIFDGGEEALRGQMQ